jgi:hypothetical protein
LRTRLEIKKIELFSLFKLAFYLYAVVGLVMAVVYGFFLLVIGGIQSAVFGSEIPRLGAVGIVLGILSIPIIALIYGAVASVFITIGGWIFNLFAGAVGGIRVEAEVEEVLPEPLPKAASRPFEPAGYGTTTPPDGPTLTRSTKLDDD